MAAAAPHRDRQRHEIESLPAWLTTVTTRLCLDRLRSRTPVPVEDADLEQADADRRRVTILLTRSSWPTPSVSR